MCRVRANQNAERPVSTRPLSGISVGRTTSKVEMRSDATSSSRSPSSAYSSRTLPLPTCRVSGIDGLPLSDERVQALEDGVDVTDGCCEVEDGFDAVRPERVCDRIVGADEVAEVALLVPCAHRMRLHEPVRLVSRQARLDEREQQPVAEEEVVARVEVAAHPVGVDDEAVDDPDEPVEHVVER